MKLASFISVLVALLLVASSFTGNPISFMSLITTLADSTETIHGQSADLLFKRVYEVSPSIINFTITADWGAFNFLRPVLMYFVRGFGMLLDIGNYAVWFVNALWTGLVYLVNLTGLLFGLG